VPSQLLQSASPTERRGIRLGLYVLAALCQSIALGATALSGEFEDAGPLPSPGVVSDCVTVQALLAGVEATQSTELLDAGGLTLSSPELFTELVAEQLLVRGYAVIGIDNVAPPTQGGQPGPDVVASILADAAAAFLPGEGAALTQAQVQAFLQAVVAASPAVQPSPSV